MFVVALVRPPLVMAIWLVVLPWVVLLVMTSALPVVLPIVKLLGETAATASVKKMPPRFNDNELVIVALIEIAVLAETALNVATSALVIEPPVVVPGNVATPVLQLFSVPAASQMPL